jgi:bacterioferritin-associated ferredoxin
VESADGRVESTGGGADQKTIVCRCEDLTLEDIRRLIRQGYTSLDEIRRVSRCGMGPCQGKTCRELVLGELARYLGKDISDLRMPTFRPPTKPVKLALIARGDQHEK